MKQDYSVKDILNAVDDILKVKSIQSPVKKIINEIYLENESTKKVVSNLESTKAKEKEKENEIKKRYDLLVMNNAKDILILNRIIFK